MIAGFEEGAKNGVSLLSLLEANAFEMAVKDVLSLAHHLARQGRLIIDAILQHGGRTESRISPGHLENEIHFHRDRGDFASLAYNQSFP